MSAPKYVAISEVEHASSPSLSSTSTFHFLMGKRMMEMDWVEEKS